MSERKNITQPSDWWRAFEQEAARRKVSLSQWVGECCRAALPQKTKRELEGRAGRGRPKAEE